MRALLSSVEDVELIAEADSGSEAVRLVEEFLPDVVLMDIQMPGSDGLEATRIISTRYPSVAVLVLSMYNDDDTIFDALRAGARGYVLKGAEQDGVISAVRAVGAGQVILGQGAADRVLASLTVTRSAPTLFPELSARERQVLGCVANGDNNATIAGRLHLAPKTVANHVSNILTKLQFADRAEAIVRARRAGLLGDPEQP